MGPNVLEVVVLLSLLILSLSFHEAAHAWTANRLGDPTARQLGRLTLNPLAHIDWIGTVLFPVIALTTNAPLIGWAKPVPVDGRNLRSPRRDFAVVALAGPVSNLILAAAGAAIFKMLAPGDVFLGDVTLPELILLRFVLLNVLLAVFNMIPVPPLDGGNVAIGLLPEPLANMLEALRPWGFLVLYALLLTGILARMTAPVYSAVFNWLL